MVVRGKRTARGIWKIPKQREKETDWTRPGLSAREVRIVEAEGKKRPCFYRENGWVPGRSNACELEQLGS